MIYKQIIDNFRQATSLKNSFQEYNVLSNVVNNEPIDLNFGQNYQDIVADLVVLQLKKEIQKIVLSENQKESEKTKIDISI
ncbi:hypothetical protein BpHYR1_012507 [Brachionus plicatilis]|uniref:Uncharacterized protein n=1 Tax=Brachionus plicatilis TaxID=10195 RepID=A0A3M7QL46_BRAPC|nr:hypothetical protein BpHYR1_012507 [Brachionus plicatilis]